MDDLDSITISQFKQISNFTLTVEAIAVLSVLNCGHVVTVLNTVGEEDSLSLDCLDENDGAGNTLSFSLPDSDESINIFQGHAEDPSDFTFELGCVSSFTSLCKWNDYRVTATFLRQIPSSRNGTDFVTESVTHRFDDNELFELNLYLQ
jgi:hypothetical protein